MKGQLTIGWCLAALALFACSSDDSSVAATPDGGASSAGALPCDVSAVLQKNCQSCHGATPSYGAPMPLVTLADLQADAPLSKGKKVYEVVKTRIHDTNAPMPQPPNAPLTEADKSLLDGWIGAGAPAGTQTTACASTTPPKSGVDPLACNVDQHLRPSTKYTVPKSSDIYVCYGFDVQASQKRHVIAGAPHIDNPAVVHHVLLYQADTAVSPVPTECGSGGGVGWRLVSGWAPGGKNFELPPEAGFAEESGTTHWALQIHYNNASGLADQQDESGYDLCSTDQLRPNDADIIATGTYDIEIQARAGRTSTCEMTVPDGFGNITIVSAWSHMHKLGKAEYAKRIRDGAETMILDSPNYDFSTGAEAQTVTVPIQPGDKIRTMCRWENKTDTTVGFGEGTADEMCYAFLTYYPKITRSPFHWSLPALPQMSKCQHADTPL